MNKILQKIINIIHRDRFVGEKKAKGLGRVVEGRTVTRKQVTSPTPPPPSPRPRPPRDSLSGIDTTPRIPVAKLQVATYFDRDVEKVPRPYVKLQWNQYRGGGFILYRIERSLDGKTWETLTEIYDQERVEYHDRKVKVETSYYYRLWVITQVAKGCSRIKRAYVRRDDQYGLVKQECLTTDFKVKKVVDDAGVEVVGGGLIKKGVTVDSFENSVILRTLGSENPNPAFEDDNGDGHPDKWNISIAPSTGATYYLGSPVGQSDQMGGKSLYLHFTGDDAVQIWVDPDFYFPCNSQIEKIIKTSLYYITGGQNIGVEIAVYTYDKDKNPIGATEGYALYVNTNVVPYQEYALELDTTKDNNGQTIEYPAETKYFRVVIYITSPAGNDGAELSIGYFAVIPKTRINYLQVNQKLYMNNHKIVLLADPTSSSDAATKNYVDTKDPTLKQYDSSNRPTCDASRVGMMILYNYDDTDYWYQDVQVCMGNSNISYRWVTIKTIQLLKEAA